MKDFFSRFLLRVKEDWQQFIFPAAGLTLIFLTILTALYQIYDIHALLAEADLTENHLANAPATLKRVKEIPTRRQEPLFGFKENGTLPTQPIKWHLNGIILEKNPKESRAVIASTPSDEAVYQRGNTLPDGAVITDIQVDRVLLSINGRTETLLIWDSKDKTNPESVNTPQVPDPEN